MAVLTKGDDAKIPYQLKKDGATFAIDAGATIKAVITNVDRTLALSTVVTIDKAATGTNLLASLIIVEFTSAESAAITEIGDALLEVQVDDDGKLTWSSDILIREGLIA